MGRYKVYDPLKSKRMNLPESKGCYLITLRSGASFISCKEIPVEPKWTSIECDGENLKVVFVGVTQDLRNEYRNHFLGSAGNDSVFWKSIGCLMGHRLYQDKLDSSHSDSTRFSAIAGNIMKKWIRENLLFLYDKDNKQQLFEQDLVNLYNPPLNIVSNNNPVNVQYREGLFRLRNKPAVLPKKKKDTNTIQSMLNDSMLKMPLLQAGQRIFCPLCGAELAISNDLKDNAYLRCSTCGGDFPNPLVRSDLTSKTEKGLWNGEKGKLTSKGWLVTIIIGIVLGLCLMDTGDPASTVPKDSPTKAPGKIVVYLKRHYLKDPDSYEGIEWGPSGKYDDNTYYMWHKYRAKNSYGGYVIEEKMFLLDADGNVVEMFDK